MSFSQGWDKRFCDICVGFYDFCIRKRKKITTFMSVFCDFYICKRKKLRHLCPFFATFISVTEKFLRL